MVNDSESSVSRMSLVMMAVVILLVANIIATVAIGIYVFTDHSVSDNSFDGKLEYKDKYVIYIGLNDKDTGEQKYTVEEATDIANHICAKYVGGYTMYTAKGGWTGYGYHGGRG